MYQNDPNGLGFLTDDSGFRENDINVFNSVFSKISPKIEKN